MPRVQQVKATNGRAKKKKAPNGFEIVNVGYDPAVAVETLRRHPKNARKSDTQAIEESIEHNAFYGSLVVRKKDRTILAGHGRMDAAVHKGATSLPVVWVDVDDATADRIVAADNRTSDIASYDPEAHAALLRSLRASDNLVGTGYSSEDVAKLLEKSRPSTPPSGMPSGQTEHVRTVQLFFSIEQHEEFNRLTQALAGEFKTNNVTDTVLEAVRRARQA